MRDTAPPPRNTTIAGPDFFDWRARNRSFEALSYFTGAGETSVTVNNVSDYTMSIPNDIPNGTYYVGAIVTVKQFGYKLLDPAPA